MPEYLGPYGMYGILGVLALLLVLLVVINQRRKKAAAQPARPRDNSKTKQTADKRPSRADKRARYAELNAQASREVAAEAAMPAYAPSGAQGPLPQAPLPPLGTVPQQPTPASAVAPAPRVNSVPIEHFMPESDPLQTVLVDILSGWGDITQEDTNRLGVFRPDRVLNLLATAEMPRELKSNDQARVRLSQLRRWGSGLEQAMKAAQAQPRPQQEYAGIAAPLAQQPAVPVQASQAPAAGAATLAGTAAFTGAAAAAAPFAAQGGSQQGYLAGRSPAQPAAPQQPVVPQQPAPAPTVPRTSSFYGTPEPELQPEQPAAPAVSVPPVQPATPEMSMPPAQPTAPFTAVMPSQPQQPAPQYAPAPGPESQPAPAAAAPAPAQEPVWQPEAAAVPAPEPVWQPEAAAAPLQPAAPQVAPQMGAPAEPQRAGIEDVTRSTEAAIAAAAAAFWARPEVGGTPPAAETPPTAPAAPQAGQMLPLGQDLPVLNVPTPSFQPPAAAPAQQSVQDAFTLGVNDDTFFDDLRAGVTTADGLLALPPDDRIGALAFLQPVELAKLLKSGADVELKKATIEQLKSVGSPSALDIIYRSLDDPDPQIQAKALEAADRLLGADQ